MKKLATLLCLIFLLVFAFSVHAGWLLSGTSVTGGIASPTVTTQAVDGIHDTNATGHGTIVATGGENCSKRGICWDAAPIPTTDDSKAEDSGSYGTGSFSKLMPGLLSDSTYYVRSYAYNSAGYGYGDQVEFKTNEVPDDAPINWASVIAAANGTTCNVTSEAEFEACVAAAGPGDVILIEDGTYSYCEVVISSNGTAAQPVIYTARNPGNVIFQNGQWLFWFSGSHNIVGGLVVNNVTDDVFRFYSQASYNRLTDNNITNPGTLTCGRGYINIREQSHHNRIDHNNIVGAKDAIRIWLDGDAVTNGPSQHNRIDHNTIEDPAYSNYPVLQIGQGIGRPDSRWLEAYTIFEHNTINSHYTAYVEIISVKCCNNILRYNDFYDCRGCVNLQTGNYNEVYGNYIHTSRGGGIGISGAYNKVYNNVIDLSGDHTSYSGIVMTRWGERASGSHLSPAHDNIVAYNTIINYCGYGLRIGDLSGTACRPLYDCNVTNNIIVGDDGTLFHYNTSAYTSGNELCDPDDWPYLGDGLNDVDISNNLFFKSGTAVYGSAYDLDLNKVVGDPNLIDIFHLTYGSIAIDQGANVTDITDDYYGTARGDTPDIGAYESNY